MHALLSNLDVFEKQLWLMLKYNLQAMAQFEEEHKRFYIPHGKPFHGRYYLSNSRTGKNVQADNEILIRVGHPMVQSIIDENKRNSLPCHEVVFNYSQSPEKISYIEQQLIGKSGWMHVESLAIDSFEQEDHLLISCFTDDGIRVPNEIAERVLMLYATDDNELVKVPNEIIHKYNDDINGSRINIIDESAMRNQNFFDDEMDKLDIWADDMKLSLDREIRDLDAEIKLRKGEAKKLTKLADKLAIQRVIKDLESKRKEKRQNLYEAQDEIDERKESLISKVEKMLDQKVEQKVLFTFKWRIV